MHVRGHRAFRRIHNDAVQQAGPKRDSNKLRLPPDSQHPCLLTWLFWTPPFEPRSNVFCLVCLGLAAASRPQVQPTRITTLLFFVHVQPLLNEMRVVVDLQLTRILVDISYGSRLIDPKTESWNCHGMSLVLTTTATTPNKSLLGGMYSLSSAMNDSH